MVLGLISVLLGISFGALQRTVPRRELARNELLDKLRLARVFAQAEQAPAWVVVEPGGEESWPVITALGLKTVGTWHLEDLALEGFPPHVAPRALAAEEVPDGIIGAALRLDGGEPSGVVFGIAQAFESPHGAACELFVRWNETVPRTLFQKGEVFALTVDGEGLLHGAVRVLDPAEDGKAASSHVETLASPVACIPVGTWTKVSFSFDGWKLRLAVDDRTVAETRLLKRSALGLNPQAPLQIGSLERPFAGDVDEVRYGIYVAESSEPLVDAELVGPLREVHFAPGGELDATVHPTAAELHLTCGGGDLWVRVGLLGNVN